MEHNFFLNAIVGAFLFIINSVFFGAATWSFILETAAQTTGLMLSSGTGEYATLAAQGEALIPIILAIIINIVLYYGLAMIVLFVFSFFSKKSA